ncbi:M20/M25/M40 family metallo-hydrolase [Ligilactobacillus faecis]|uniref:M20/M25/M40 family metallo-hydrolase n=1 Tax=Ligilactobacillus faecis TaxID=762833 RepID=A0ABV4DRV5_9LACO
MGETLRTFARKHLMDHAELFTFRSVSTERSELDQTAEYLVKTFNELGATRIEKLGGPGHPPAVFAEFTSERSDKTVLFYQHYDVQPPEPLEKWLSDPFVPVIRDEKLYARGASDNKGELISRLVLVKYFQEHGGLPVNIKFFVEGEEENGSPHVEEIVRKNRFKLQADACIWEGGGKNYVDNYQIVGGMRGITIFDVQAVTADIDLHSSLASYAENAAWRLVRGLASLRADDGTVLVEGFYDDVEPLSPKEEQAVFAYDFDLDVAISRAGLRRTIKKDHKVELVNQPTLTINGITSGYQGKGIKTVIPHLATAKLDCRLTPSQDPEKIAELIQKQLIKNGYPDLKVRYRLGENGYRSEMDDPFIQLALAEAKKQYGPETKYLPNSAGGGPAEVFGKLLELPIAILGVSYAGSQVHSPNEHIRLADFVNGTELLGKILVAYGREK